jgi:hypothetical protein
MTDNLPAVKRSKAVMELNSEKVPKERFQRFKIVITGTIPKPTIIRTRLDSSNIMITPQQAHILNIGIIPGGNFDKEIDMYFHESEVKPFYLPGEEPPYYEDIKMSKSYNDGLLEGKKTKA